MVTTPTLPPVSDTPGQSLVMLKPPVTVATADAEARLFLIDNEAGASVASRRSVVEAPSNSGQAMVRVTTLVPPVRASQKD